MREHSVLAFKEAAFPSLDRLPHPRKTLMRELSFMAIDMWCILFFLINVRLDKQINYEMSR